ncbi:MAG: hypothetical protein ACE5JN_13045, partial [Candidatus Methylomirabilia bacterium]
MFDDKRYGRSAEGNARPHVVSAMPLRRISPLFLAALFSFATVTPASPHPVEEPVGGSPALPGESCQIPSLPTWRLQERWVWEQVCEGKIANLAAQYGGSLEPGRPRDWPSERILRPAFLETILLHEPYRSALTRTGVRIVGARFEKALDLSDATLARPVLVHNSRWESGVTISRLRSLHSVSLDGSRFLGPVHMDALQVEGDLLMR